MGLATASDLLTEILEIAADERRLRNSPTWKTDLEEAMEAHGDAVDRLYDKLYAILDERAANGAVVKPARRQIVVDPSKAVRKAAVDMLKARLPGMVDAALDELDQR